MLPVVLERLLILESNQSINEAAYSDRMNQLLDQKMMDYINDNMKDPRRKEQFLRAQKRYSDMAKRATDPVTAMYFEYRTLLPKDQAKILAREFYQSEIRSGTVTDVAYGDDGETYSKVDTIGYGNTFADKGMFADLGSKGSNPQKTFEIDDFLTKLFNSKYLDHRDRLVLVTRLLLGSGPNLRNKSGSKNFGMDLEGLMNHPPSELKDVEDQITKLIKFGIEVEDINPSKVLGGVNKNDADTGSVNVAPMVDSKRVKSAEDNIQKALKSLAGTEDMDQVRKFMLVDREYRLNEDLNIEEAVGDGNIAVDAINSYIEGSPVTMGNLIKAISLSVQSNIKIKTPLTKTTYFNGTFKDICKRYIGLAKKGGDMNIFTVQDMMMAPALEPLRKELEQKIS